MKAFWLRLAGRYDGLLVRERWLIAAAVLGGIVLIGFSLFVSPAMKRAHLAERTVLEQRAQLANVQAQMVVLQSPSQNPDVAARAELASVKDQLNALGARLRVLEGTLVPPQRVSALLEDMIGHKSSLRLLRLKTLPVSPLLEKSSDGTKGTTAEIEGKSTDSSAGLFKHGVEITLEGNYQELAAYLERLEQSKLKLLWRSVSLSADNYPKLVLTLTVYTLSLDRTWLIV